MTKYIIQPIQSGKLSGCLTVPPSKSQSMRAVLLASLGRGHSQIRNLLKAPDVELMIEICRDMGAEIRVSNDLTEVWGFGAKPERNQPVINAGNSGIILRFVSAIAGLGNKTYTLTGDDSICSMRPMQTLLDALSDLGANASSIHENGFAPLEIKGPLQAGTVKLSGQDSQPISALLIATSFLEGKSEIHVDNPGETPWIDLTLDWLRFLGVTIHNHNYTQYVVEGYATYAGFTYRVPGDWSSAAFPLTAAVLSGSELTLHNLDMNDPQGDKQIVDLLIDMGVNLEIDEKEKSIKVLEGKHALKGREVDVNAFIDALPILSVLGTVAEGGMHLKNAAVARTKESDRITVMTSELKKMGADIEERDDGMIIRPSKLHGAELDSHQDHRIAMSLTIAGLCAEGTTIVNDVEMVSKTYPKFREEMQSIGADIQ
ncbi:3-phosphoshikimate 1-carboxyvinyltransferase [Chlamydiales bacterium SCGC AG-110-M15]|nr:3-phosphoshikimate 1-carboxyvinyltransferase [Chlamydiales bacterium SCGC AG-110-M15]